MHSPRKVCLTPDGIELLRRLVLAEENSKSVERARMIADAERQAEYTRKRLIEELDGVGVDDRLVILYSDFETPDESTAMKLAALGRQLGASFEGTTFVKRVDEEHLRRESPGYVLSMTRGELIALLQAPSPPS